jgi:hypothetical protein
MLVVGQRNRLMVLLLLAVAVALSYTGAFWLRCEFLLPSSVEEVFVLGLCNKIRALRCALPCQT